MNKEDEIVSEKTKERLKAAIQKFCQAKLELSDLTSVLRTMKKEFVEGNDDYLDAVLAAKVAKEAVKTIKEALLNGLDQDSDYQSTRTLAVQKEEELAHVRAGVAEIIEAMPLAGGIFELALDVGVVQINVSKQLFINGKDQKITQF